MPEATPVNTSPFLISRGCGSKPTRHIFIEKQRHVNPRPPKNGEPQKPDAFDDLIFSCTDCKTHRQYGREQA